MSIRRRAGLSERGETLIEFALVLPILLVVTLAAVDFGRAFFVKNILAQSAREAVRYLVVNAAADSVNAKARAIQIASVAGVVVTADDISTPEADPVSKLQEVSVTADFNWLFPSLYRWVGATLNDTTPLTGTAYMRKEG